MNERYSLVVSQEDLSKEFEEIQNRRKWGEFINTLGAFLEKMFPTFEILPLAQNDPSKEKGDPFSG